MISVRLSGSNVDAGSLEEFVHLRIAVVVPLRARPGCLSRRSRCRGSDSKPQDRVPAIRGSTCPSHSRRVTSGHLAVQVPNRSASRALSMTISAPISLNICWSSSSHSLACRAAHDRRVPEAQALTVLFAIPVCPDGPPEFGFEYLSAGVRVEFILLPGPDVLPGTSLPLADPDDPFAVE